MKKVKISFHGATRLREERERIGFSQLDAESLFGISRVTWGKYERGETTPGADVLTALVAAGADVYYILTSHRMPLGVAQSSAPHSPADRAAAEIQALTLTEADAELVAAMARRLAVGK